MDVVLNKTLGPQRRILVETPGLVALFDLFHSFLTNERDLTDVPIPVNFEEVSTEIESVIEAVVSAVVERIEADEMIAFMRNAKTEEVSIDPMCIGEVILNLINEERDGLIGILAGALNNLLTEACKTILDETIREGELLNLKNIRIKTRRHAVVIC